MLVAVLVRVRQQRLLAVRLLDLAIAARRAHALEPEDVVEGRRLAAADAEHGGLLLDGKGAALVALAVLAGAGAAAAA